MVFNNVPVIVTGGYDSQLVIWSALEAQPLGIIPFLQSQVNCLAYGQRTQLITAGGHCCIRSFDIEKHGPNIEPVVSYVGHTGNITSICFDSTERFFLSCSEDRTAKIWDIRSPPSQQLSFENQDAIYTACMNPNDILCCFGDSSGYIRVWDLIANRISHSIQVPTASPVHSIDISPDGAILSAASFNGVTTLYDMQSTLLTDYQSHSVNFSLLYSFKPHDDNYVSSIKFSPVDSLFATASSDATIGVWETDVSPIHTTSSISNEMCHNPVSPIGAQPKEDTEFQNELLFNSEQSIPMNFADVNQCNHLLLQSKTGSSSLSHTAPPLIDSASASPYSACRSLSNELLASTQSETKTHHILNTVVHKQDDTFVQSLIHNKEDLRQLKQRQTVSKDMLFKQQWLSQWRNKHHLLGHKRWIWDIVFSADGQYIISASSDTTARLWDIQTSQEICIYKGTHTKPITSVALIDTIYERVVSTSLYSEETDSLSP